jgi:hypothetical protein
MHGDPGLTPAAKTADPADPAMQLPPTVTMTTPGLFVLRPIAVSGDAVSYTTVDNGVQLIPSDLLKDSTVACGIVLQPGTYRIRAIVAKNVNGVAKLSPFYETTIQLGPVTPPQPPVPPVPPQPADPFTVSVANAYSTDADAKKAEYAAWAASVYLGAPSLIGQPNVKTYADLLAAITNGLHNTSMGFPKGSIPKTLGVIAADENKIFGTNGNAPIDPVVATAALKKYAAALSTLK